MCSERALVSAIGNDEVRQCTVRNAAASRRVLRASDLRLPSHRVVHGSVLCDPNNQPIS